MRLGASSKDSGQSGVLALMQALQPAVVYTNESNVDTNRKLWDAYAQEWTPDEEWVRREAKRAGVPEAEMEEHLHFLGDEWTNKQDLDSVLGQYVFPYIKEGAVVGEVGSGGP